MLRAYQAVDHEHSSPWRQAFSIAWRVYLPIRLALLVIGIIIEALGWSGPTINAGSWMVERLVLRPWEQMDVDWYFHVAPNPYWAIWENVSQGIPKRVFQNLLRSGLTINEARLPWFEG